MNGTILVVDDEKEIADLVELYLKSENYTVYKFYSGRDALDFLDKNKVDLAILDVMLPSISGFTICQKIRDKYNYPVIMLTAKDEEIDKITGLTIGADDYITKPFRPLELVARVKAQLRRYLRYNGGMEQEDNIIELSGLVINIETHECTLNEKPLSLTPTEFSILKILSQKQGNVVSAEELFHEIWKDEYYSKSNNTITVHIRHLREKMNDSVDNPKYIKTIWGWVIKLINKKKLKNDYTKFEQKLSLRIFLIAIGTGIGISVIISLITGKFGNAVVAFLQRNYFLDYEDAITIYQYTPRNNKVLIIALVGIIGFWVMMRVFISFMTRYFDEISQGLDDLMDKADKDIILSPEMSFLQVRLNECKYILKQREQDAKLAEQRKNDLVVYLAHDIKTPLTSVIGYLSLLEEAPDMQSRKQNM